MFIEIMFIIEKIHHQFQPSGRALMEQCNVEGAIVLVVLLLNHSLYEKHPSQGRRTTSIVPET